MAHEHVTMREPDHWRLTYKRGQQGGGTRVVDDTWRLMAYSDAQTVYYYAMKKFKRPKIDNFRNYCYECAHWTFIRDIGCAHEGVCNAIDGEPTEQDAYDKMCGLFCHRTRRNVP